MKKSNKLRFLLIVLFLFLSCSFFAVKKSYAIYRTKLNTKVRLSILDSSSTVGITLNTHGANETYDVITKTPGQTVGVLPTPTKTNYNFVGWWTTEDDTGVRVEPDDILMSSVTYHAHWVKIVCKKATTLHQETCTHTDATGCRALVDNNNVHVYSLNSTITYGTLPTDNSPIAGDAYDCDVNNDGTYNASTERFYFLRDNLSVDDTAVLLHFTNFDESGQCDDSTERKIYTYANAPSVLPNSSLVQNPNPDSLWDNPALVSFDGKPSRLPSEEDIETACGPITFSNTGTSDTKYLLNCQYFLENTRFQGSDKSRSAIWLSSDNGYLLRIHSTSINVNKPKSDSSNAVRPVIEIPYNALDGYKEKVVYNVTLDLQGGMVNNSSAPITFARYEDQVLGTLPVPTRDGFNFLGWFDENDVQVSADTVVAGQLDLYAHWEEVIVDLMPYVFRIPGTCTFPGSSGSITSTSNDCISTINPTGDDIDYTQSPNSTMKYIDTLVSLYSDENYDKDYEIGFTIVEYVGSSNVNQASLMSTKLEYNDDGYNYPGLVFRKKDNNNLQISQTSNKVNKQVSFAIGNSGTITSANPVDVKIVREDGVIKVSYNGGELTTVQTLSGNYDHFNFHTWFGGYGTAADLDATVSAAQRLAKATLSNMYIKLESDQTITHNVSFDGGDGATVSPFSSKTVTHGSEVGELPIATKTGFVFDGWWTQESGGSQITTSTLIGSDKTFYAHWKDIYYITFHPVGGTLSITPNDTLEVPDGGTLTSLPTATKTGFVFDGWYTEETGGTKITGDEVITADDDYYAHWKNIYHITFHTDGGTLSPTTNPVDVVDGGTLASLPTATKTGLAFDGWYTEEIGGTKITGDEVITADDDYYAHYKELFDVTFVLYGGTINPSTMPNPLQVGDGDTVIDTIGELPTANKEGVIFDGWYTAETGGTKYTGNEVITADVTYHAQYKALATVTFSPGEGVLDAEITPFDTKTVIAGSAVGTLPSATRGGYSFDGWFTDTTWTTEVDPDETIVTGDVTFVAKWTFIDYEARIGSKYYEHFADAFATTEIPKDGVKRTVVLLKNVATTAKIGIASGQNVELDLQNYTLSNDSTNIFENFGTLSITNGTIIDRGAESSGKNAGIINKAGGTLNISGGTLNATQTNIIVNTGVINMTGGILQASGQSACINVDGGSVMVSGGSIIGTSTTKGQAIYNNGGTTTISGDAYLKNKSQTGSGSGRAALHNLKGTVHINGGTIISEANAAVKNNGTMTIGIDDDTFDNTSPVMQGYNYGLEIVANYPVNVYGGIFKGRVSTNNKAISDENLITYDTTNAELVHDSETIDGAEYVTAYLNSTSVTNYTVTFNTNNGSMVGDAPNTKTVLAGSAVGTLPKAEKSDTEFLGWFASASGGEKLLPTTVVDDDVTYYARYTTSMTVCRPATTLHSVSGTDFGQIHSGSNLAPGDAYDCDVNGDGTYDATNERFYYLTDSGSNALFIHSNNTAQVNNNVSSICSVSAVAYGDDYAHGPTNAMELLPTTSQWINVSLYTEPRDIKNNVGTSVISDYVYTGKAARFATVDEIKEATVSTLNGTTNELANYSFLLENTAVYTSGCRSNYWLETPNSSAGAYRIDGGTSNGKKLGHADGNSGVRPVIEVPYSVIQGAIVEFDIMSPAMRAYFDNISTWASGQTDASHSSFDTAMTSNLNNNKCVYFENDVRDTEVNYSTYNVYCDQPNQYDTGVTGNVNVYEYNESTGTTTAASYVTANNGKLYNFIPNKVYYWESATNSSKNGYVKAIGERRIISIDNTTPTPQPKYKMRNVRDLGGIKVDTNGDGTIDGTIKYGKLFRSEKIWGDENATVPYLTKLGINHELDLRANSEPVTGNEDNSLPKITSNPNDSSNVVFEIIHYGIDYDNDNSNYLLARNAATKTMYEFVKAHNAGDDTYSLIFHCRIGADRTGTLAYILEGLLGAPVEERYRDYELTVFFGLRERTRFYYAKGSNTVKFQYLKAAIRNAGDGVNEDVMTWFLKDGNTVDVIDQDTKQTVSVNLPQLISDFRSIMIDYN